MDRLAELLPHAAVATIRGAGHTPHATHPAEYAELVAAFVAAATAAGPEAPASRRAA